MSRLAELIEELCPDGVEYRTLGAIADLQRGAGMPKKLFVDKGIPAIHYGHIFTKYGIQTKCAAAYLAPEDAEKLTRVYPGDLVVANTSENLEDVGKGVVWLGDVEGVTGGHATVVRSLVVDTVFLSYYLRTEDFALKKRKYAQGTKVIELSAVNLSKIDIPVPPLEVQREIVRILDQFTTLEAELEARRTQYEHYRNHLLSYDSLAARGRVEWCALGDLVRICNGRDYKTLSAGDVPVYGSGGVMTYVSDYLSVGPTVLIPRKGSLDNIYFVEGQFWTVDTIFYTEIGDALHPKFFFHYMKQMKLSRMNEAAGVPSMTQRKLSSIRIPIPSHEEQQRIVDLLDSFDGLVNDISAGLPAEIAARRTQYEHYRDHLLSFPEKHAD